MAAYDAGILTALTGGVFDGALVVPVGRAAKLIGVSRAQIYILMAQGKLKIGRLRRIEVAEIGRFIAAHRVG